MIGAGQAGLAASYHLAARGIEHVVLERGRIGDTWRTQRWDTFALNTPGWRSHLRADDPDRRMDDDAFLTAAGFVGRLETFAARHRLPVREGVVVTGVAPAGRTGEGSRSPRPAPTAATNCGREASSSRPGSSTCHASRRSRRRCPPGCPGHGRDYRAPACLPTGAVLVVGGRPDGRPARRGPCRRRPTDLPVHELRRPDPGATGAETSSPGWAMSASSSRRRTCFPTRMLRWPQPQVSGVGPLGRTVSLQGLAAQGVTLLGRPLAVDGDRIALGDSVGADIAFGDRISGETRALVDRYIDRAGLGVHRPEDDPADIAHPDPASVRSPATLDLERRGSAASCGRRASAATSAICRGRPRRAGRAGPRSRHRDDGRALRHRVPVAVETQVGIIPGVDEDAERIADASHAGRPGDAS